MKHQNGFDLHSLSIEDLEKLGIAIQEEVTKRRGAERERVFAQMDELAGQLGLTLEEIVRQERDRKYRHPNNSSLVWSGRGKRPAWVVDWLAEGHTLEELVAQP